MNKNYRIVTISNRVPTEYYYTYEELFKSVPNDEILILGRGEIPYTGLSDKPRILYHAITSGSIKEKYIVFVDAWDVVFASSLYEIMDKYKSFNSPIVIGAERNCFPQNFKKEYDRLISTSSFKYLNSGVIIGEIEAMLTVLEAMDAPNLPVDYHDSRFGRNYHFNDQAYYMDIFLRQPVKMRLDYDCLIAQNMQDVNEEDLKFNHRIRNLETNTCPSIIHWNGSSKDKWSREPILNHLKLI